MPDQIGKQTTSGKPVHIAIPGNETPEILNDKDERNDIDGISIRRHSWQYSENGFNTLTANTVWLPENRPQSHAGNIKMDKTLNSCDIHTDSPAASIPESIDLGSGDNSHACEMAKDILINIVENAVTKDVPMSGIDRMGCNDYNDHTKEEKLLDPVNNDIATSERTSEIIPEPNHSIVDEIQENNHLKDVSFKATYISEILDEIIDLTVKEPKILNLPNIHLEEHSNCPKDTFQINILNEFKEHESNEKDKIDALATRRATKTKTLVSSFDPIHFKTILLQDQSSSQPLDTRAISATLHLLLNTPSNILAFHLTKIDYNLFFPSSHSLDGRESGLFMSSGFRNGVDDKHLQIFLSDVLERSVCLKKFVIVTICTAKNIKESARICSKWIRIATHLIQKLGNLFGFFNVLSGLNGNQLIQWGDLWIYLKEVMYYLKFLMNPYKAYRYFSNEIITIVIIYLL